MTNTEAIEQAISALKSGDCATITDAAKLYQVNRSTLSRRFNGKTVSRQEAASIYTRHLSNTQEQAIITWINGLANRGLPPTPQMIRNEVQYVLKCDIGMNWVTKFYKRHSSTIISKYLKGIDKARYIAENKAYFNNYYQQVRSY
jgi:Tc5 transposase DNA-binding domain/helix-turn-helix, Psq domain